MKGDPVRDAKGNLIAVNMMGRLMPVEKITGGHVAAYLWVLVVPLVMICADSDSCAAIHGGRVSLSRYQDKTAADHKGAKKSMDSAERTKETRKLAKEEKARKLAERNLALPS
jgi:hypothetical protein